MLLVLAMWPLTLASLSAQTEHAHGSDPAAPGSNSAAWIWSWDARVFAGWNYQRRKFRDFQQIESQNWFMGSGERQMLGGPLRVHAMVSLEPLTIRPLGSPQVFQTGETYRQAPLIDYQHPHDLFMGLGVQWARPLASGRMFAELAPVGAPAIGPAVFMHRPSASDNPAAPLGHHQLDATHITHGVFTAGVERNGLMLEGSWFRGTEPDENRKDIDFGPLDSYSGRLSWRRHGWDAQVSAAHLTTPEWIHPFSDVTRLTASIGFMRSDGRLAALVAWGQNRETHGNLDAYLLEATLRTHAQHAWYTRVELTTKDILNAGGRHPPGFLHFHPLSRVGALTGGYVFDAVQSRAGRFGIGGDVSVYHVPPNLADNYGAPVSVHLFIRYRPIAGGSHVMH
ncbi:MAG: hypothetical protein ACRD3C_11815 [Vicinamibacterales bacterium]